MNAAPISYVAEDADGVFAFGTLLGNGYVLYLMCHPRQERQGAATDILAALEERNAQTRPGPAKYPGQPLSPASV